MNPAATRDGEPAEGVTLSSLERFPDSTADLLAGRLLQTRVDRKFVLSRELLPGFLAGLDDGHRLLRAAGAPAATYETIYFDTSDGRMYDDHRRGHVPRFKVRLRHQLERQMSFLEIKRKGLDGMTSKARQPRAFRNADLDADATSFIAANSPFSAAQLGAVLWITFRRATLLSTRSEERITLDWGFEFGGGEQSARWPRAAIVEVKQPHHIRDTSAIRVLRDLGIREAGVSKFCLGISTISEGRQNDFIPARRQLERVSA